MSVSSKTFPNIQATHSKTRTWHDNDLQPLIYLIYIEKYRQYFADNPTSIIKQNKNGIVIKNYDVTKYYVYYKMRRYNYNNCVTNKYD